MNRLYITDEKTRMLVLAGEDVCEGFDELDTDRANAAKSLWVMMQTMAVGEKLDFATDIKIDGINISASSWYGVRRVSVGFDCGDVWIFAHYGGGGVWSLSREDCDDDDDAADRIAWYFADNDICEVAVELSN